MKMRFITLLILVVVVSGCVQEERTTTTVPETAKVTTTIVSLDRCTLKAKRFGKMVLIPNETRLTADGNFTGVFMNGAGNTIELYDISVRNTITNTSCSRNFTVGTQSYLFPMPHPHDPIHSELRRSGIKLEYPSFEPGARFPISSIGCNNNKTKKVGEKFTLNITIRYIVAIGEPFGRIGANIITGCYA